jgi:CBS domain-containing protein
MHITGTIDSLLSRKPRETVAIDPEATVFEAIRLMADKNIGALLVMRGEILAGVFSERDYTRNVILRGKSSRETPVRDVMPGEVFVAGPQSTVEDCMRVMTEKRVRHLPVLEGDRVVGIVSIGDIVNWIISAQSNALAQLQDYIDGKYPG